VFSSCCSSPILPNSVSILRAKVESQEVKKLKMVATIEDAKTKKIQAESSTLFIFFDPKQHKGGKKTEEKKNTTAASQ
jgi:RNA 3'-terminal phosphate cyclase